MNNQTSEVLLADVVVGAQGWSHSHWLDSFYPDDIPDDWRLGFYANEFNTLLLPFPVWRDAIDELDEQLEDTPEDFHLYLVLPATLQDLPRSLQQFSERVTGLVCMADDPAVWQAQAADCGVALYVAQRGEGLVFQRFTSPGSGGSCELVLVSGSNIPDLAAMREQLELIVKTSATRIDMIFIDDEPDIEAMQNTRMIAELMGA